MPHNALNPLKLKEIFDAVEIPRASWVLHITVPHEIVMLHVLGIATDLGTD